MANDDDGEEDVDDEELDNEELDDEELDGGGGNRGATEQVVKSH